MMDLRLEVLSWIQSDSYLHLSLTLLQPPTGHYPVKRSSMDLKSAAHWPRPAPIIGTQGNLGRFGMPLHRKLPGPPSRLVYLTQSIKLATYCSNSTRHPVLLTFCGFFSTPQQNLISRNPTTPQHRNSELAWSCKTTSPTSTVISLPTFELLKQ